ncbi:hypothetical protein HYX01_00015 [Candidatus Woesearchaeota archaeon]|nr:hypothetical protein [Candidatus Woesearchaeota archaeon]
MTIVGFNFTKINAEKKEAAKDKINVSNNVSISDIEEKKLSIGSEKQKILGFSFEFISKYEPDIGSIKLNGEILVMDDSSKAKDVLDGWKKGKKIPKEIMTDILNAILAKCHIHALILSEEINLPPPVPLPKLQAAEP